jgi:hypothetical protein
MLYKAKGKGERLPQQVLYSLFCTLLSFLSQNDSHFSRSRPPRSSRRDHPIRGRW